MGLFDGKIKELGETLSRALNERAEVLTKEVATETNPGLSLTKKITINVLYEVSHIIQNSLSD